jgi:hypothetical protein
MAREGEIETKLREAGWRQGSVLSSAVCEQLGIPGDPQTDIAVVISQDCDVVANVQIEPDVEVIGAVETVTPDHSTLHGKHPRTLALPLVNSAAHIELAIRRRHYIPKSRLCEFPPSADTLISRKDVRTMAQWVGKRYTRDAFPDAFNLRLRPVRDKLDKLSKSDLGKFVIQVFVLLDVHDEELPPEQVYGAAFLFVFRDNPKDTDFRRAQAEQFAQQFLRIVRDCSGIEVVTDGDVKSDWETTLGEISEMKRFDFDHRSLAPKPGGEVADGRTRERLQ